MSRSSPALSLWRPLSEAALRGAPAQLPLLLRALRFPAPLFHPSLSVFIFRASQQIPAHLSLPVLSYNSILAFEKRNIFATKVFTWKQQQSP